MIELLKAFFEAIPAAASSPYGLAAFALAILACVFFIWRVARNKNLLEHIEKLPPKDRLRALEMEMGSARLAKGLSPEEWLRARTQRYYLLAFLAICAAAVAVVGLAGLRSVQINNKVTNIYNDYRQTNNQLLSEANLQLLREAVKAAMEEDSRREQAALDQLPAPAREAYRRALPVNADGRDPKPAPPTPAPPPSVIAEKEPNNDFFTANEIAVNTDIDAAIETNSDVDYFKFTMPGSKRDIVDVKVINRSPKLAPTLTLHDGNKNAWQTKASHTRGADVDYEFTAEPGGTYYIKVSPYFDYGKYRLTVKARNDFDDYEPNDSFLTATPIEIGTTIKAKIMDDRDVDYFRFRTGSQTKLIAVLENHSQTLAPKINIADGDKSARQPKANGTAGGNVSYPFGATPDSTYYVIVSAYLNRGAYSLTVRPQ